MGKLVKAIEENDIPTLKKLLAGEYKNSSLINEEKNDNSLPPLHTAAWYGHAEAIQVLIKAGAKVNLLDEFDDTPLHCAADAGEVAAIQALIKAGAKVNLSNRYDRTPFHRAVERGRIEAIQALLQLGVPVDLTTKEDCKTPLFTAAAVGKSEALQLLLKAGAKIDLPNKNGATPLLIAAKNGHVNVVQKLIEEGAKIDFLTNDGRTPLYAAAESGRMDVVQILLKAGANLHSRTKSGQAPLDIAKEKGHAEIVKLLEEHTKKQKSSLSPHLSMIDPKNAQGREIPKSSFEAVNSSITSQLEHKFIEKMDINFSFILKHGELKIGKELGKGGFGIVHQATYRYNEVAVKQLHLVEPSLEALEEFKQEMQLMAKLRCPQIVQLYGVYTEPCYGIVMEYMPNGALYSVLHSNKPLDWSIRYSIALDITKGVAFLHSENILHRDLKSLNVLLDGQMKAKLTDFGLAKIKNETTSTTSSANQAAGTLLWMAPELFQRKAQCTQKSDMYSLGMTLWELASRKKPFEDAQTPQIATTWVIQGQREDIPKDCPTPVAKLITFCWDNDASKRPTADEAVKQLLSASLKEEELSYKGNLNSGI